MDNLFDSRLIKSPNREVLFSGNKRELDIKIFSEAVKTKVQFNKETDKAEVVVDMNCGIVSQGDYPPGWSGRQTVC